MLASLGLEPQIIDLASLAMWVLLDSIPYIYTYFLHPKDRVFPYWPPYPLLGMKDFIPSAVLEEINIALPYLTFSPVASHVYNISACYA